MSETNQGEDDALEAGWGVTDSALDQSDIDNLFGDAASAPSASQPRRGLEALITNGMSGVERMPTLNIMADRLSQLMTVSIRGFIGDNAECVIDGIQPCRLKDFLDAVSVPAMIAVLRIEPWEGFCLAAFDPRLITSAMDVLLGGRRNRSAPIEGRPYTAIERTLVERLTHDVIAQDLKQAFEIIGDADFIVERFETTPSYAAVTKLSAAAIMFRAEISMEHRAGHVDFLIPISTFDPVRERLVEDLGSKRNGGDATWRTHLMTVLPHAEVELRAVVEERPISTSDVMNWRVGSQIILDRRHDEPIDVFCNELLIFRASIANKDGRIALHVDERRLGHDWPGHS
jgi:flagellar motor switch protein FliM